MPCTKCEDGKYKWGKTGDCKYATLADCQKDHEEPAGYEELKNTRIVELVIEDNNQELAIDAISLVSAPAIDEQFVFFNKEKNNLTLAKIDEEKRMLVSPALIPNKQIFRYDPNTDSEYYVYFSKETVRQASELYLKHNNHHKATYEHSDRVSGVLTVESWIKEGDSDKSKMYGFDLPNGTWFVKMKIENDDLWEKVKTKEVVGLSIEGYFVDKMQKMGTEQFSNKQIKQALKELLSSDKVELAMVDDIKKLYSDYIGQNEKYDKIYAPIFKVENDVENWIKGMEKIKSKSETLFKDTDKMMKELGVKNIPYLDDLSKIIDDKIVLAHAKAQLAVLKKF